MATKSISVYTHNGEDYTINDPNNADEFSTGTAYAVGDHVTYQGNLYVFTAAHAAGAWNASHVIQVKLGKEIADLKSAISDGQGNIIPSADLKSAVNGLDSEIDAVAPYIDIGWTLGKKIDASGAVFNSRVSAMSSSIDVSKGNIIKRNTPANDGNYSLFIDVNTYSSGTWQERISLNYHDTYTIPSNIDSVVVCISRSNSSGIDMTMADINTYYNVPIYQKTVSANGLDGVKANQNTLKRVYALNSIECDATNAINLSAPGVQVDYGYSGETSTIVSASGYVISDYIPIEATDYIRLMVDGYEALKEKPHGTNNYSRKIAVYDSNKNWQFTRNLASHPYSEGTVNIGVSGFIRVQLATIDVAELLVSSITKEKLVDLIIFMGQSNMAGRGITNTSHPEDAPIILNGAGYEFKAISNPTKLYPMEEPFGYAENVSGAINDGTRKTGSAVVAFANAYYSHNGGYPIVGVSASEGGTTISQWQPSTDRLNDAINRLGTAKTWLNANGYRIRHTYMAWCQGESDGDSETSKATYITRFNAMFAAMQTVGIEKCFLFRIGEYNGSGTTDYSDIISAQTEICQTNPDVIMVTANQASYKSRGMMKDEFHYYQDAYNEMGTYGGINAAVYVSSGKEPTMYDTKYNDLYYSHIN